MKQFIVFLALTMLGVALYQLIAGPGDASVYSMVKTVWQQEIAINRTYP